MKREEILNRLGIGQLSVMQQDFMQAYRTAPSLVLLSPTGSGKTLAYMLPLIETIDEKNDEVQAVVLVPSRELAMQTHEVVRQMGNPVRSIAVYGGRPAMDEHRSMNGLRPQLVIGTPGRMLDHLQKGNISTSAVRVLVIDEFDKSLELGFQDEMAQVLSQLPHIGKRVLLSATDSPEIPRFVGTGLEVARLNFLDERRPISERIEEWVVRSPVKDKLEILEELLCSRGEERSLVFVGYRESVERVAKYLREQGFMVSAFHGGMEQKDRERALYRFVGGSTNVMVSTDLAARGLDIPEVDNVIHYHLPTDPQAYIHRIGRTARWDAAGSSFLILGPEENFDITGLKPWEKPEQKNLPSKPRWDTLYIGKGKKDKLSKGDIAGFLMKVGGLDKESVGRIDVRDHYAYVAVARERLNETLLRVRGQKIKGIRTLFERTR